MSKGKSHRILVAEELHLVDKNNNPHMILCTDNSTGQPFWQMNDEVGMARISVSLDPDGSPRIVLLRPDGKGLVGIAANRDSGIGISINDQDGNIAIQLSVFPDNTRQIDVYDANGKPIWGAP